MSLSCLLAVAMMLNGARAGLFPVLQDTTKPETTPQSTAPAPAEAPKAESKTKEAPAEPTKAPQRKKKPDDSKKTTATTKANEAEQSTPASGQSGSGISVGNNAKPAAENEPHKVVIRRGGALEPNARISPDLPPEEALKQRQTAEEMLVAAADRLKMLAERTLEPSQQETTTQIRNYMEKARAALKEGDTQRGHTLALKAYLLADDLVKH